MPATISENLPIILIATAIILALLWWLISGRSSDETKDIPATSTPLDSLEKAVVDPVPTVKEMPKEPVVTAPSAPPFTRAVAKPKPSASATVAPKPTAKIKPQPVASAKPKAVAVPDNIGLLKGVGPKLTTLLQSLGVTSFAQIASWTDTDIIEIDSKLGNFAGRITRDNWVDQASLLSSGDIAGFEKKYGALGGDAKA